MSKQYITLKDIAKALNLSASTVSRAMKDNPAISADTRKLVQDFARKHRYKPNTLAMQLRTQRNTTIGVIVPKLVHYFFSTVLAGIQEEAENSNYNILICQSGEDYNKEVKSVETLLDARVSGILVSQSKTTFKYDHFQDAIDNNVDLVFFDRICTGINTDKVVVDDYDGAFGAVDYMASTGCKRIAFLGSDANMPIITPAEFEIKLKKAKELTGEKELALLPLDSLLKFTGYIRGGCSPLGMIHKYKTFISDLAQLEDKIYVSAGQRGTQLYLSPDDLRISCEGEFADFI